MAKRNTPIITYTEILCLAIQAAARRIHELDEMVDQCDNTAARAIAADMRYAELAIWKPKMNALKMLYKIETGTDFD